MELEKGKIYGIIEKGVIKNFKGIRKNKTSSTVKNLCTNENIAFYNREGNEIIKKEKEYSWHNHRNYSRDVVYECHEVDSKGYKKMIANFKLKILEKSKKDIEQKLEDTEKQILMFNTNKEVFREKIIELNSKILALKEDVK